MENEVTKKECKACKLELSFKEFQKSKCYEDGYYYKCKTCSKNKILLNGTPTEIYKECYSCLKTKDECYFHKSNKNNKCIECVENKIPMNKKELFKRKLKELRGDEYELIGEYSSNNLVLLHNKCGNEWKTTRRNVFKRNCGFCRLANKSSIASKFEELLIKNSICFKSEILFEDCKDKKKLPFDYGIYDCTEKLLFLVEIDGEQHFKETGYSKGGLSEIQRRDSIKTKFCLDTNILLHRIPYYEEANIKDIFDNIISGIRGCCEKEYVGYVSKSIISEVLAKEIRTMYLAEKSSIKSISRELNISEPAITKVVYYHYFPNIMEEFKSIILEKAEKLKRKNRLFTELSEVEKREIIELKEKGTADTKIALLYKVYRKGFRNYFKNWDDIVLK